jgi:hypothetical protein
MMMMKAMIKIRLSQFANSKYPRIRKATAPAVRSKPCLFSLKANKERRKINVPTRKIKMNGIYGISGGIKKKINKKIRERMITARMCIC